MGEQLKKPPLVEAMCELRFAPSSNWDWTVPGRLYDLIQGEFSGRAQVNGIGFQLSVGGGKQEASLVTGPDRVQLKRPDGSAIVQVGPALLSVNHLRPYQSWEVFRALILRILADCVKIVGQQKLARLGLRYINQLAISGSSKFEEAITVMPGRDRVLAPPLRGFYQRYELELDRPRGLLIHQTGLIHTPEGDRLMIDLDVGSEAALPEVTNSPELERWLDAAHDRIGDAFKATLTRAEYERLRAGA